MIKKIDLIIPKDFIVLAVTNGKVYNSEIKHSASDPNMAYIEALRLYPDYLTRLYAVEDIDAKVHILNPVNDIMKIMCYCESSLLEKVAMQIMDDAMTKPPQDKLLTLSYNRLHALGIALIAETKQKVPFKKG